MAITFGLLGLALASSIIASPVYIYKTDQDYTKMFPVLTSSVRLSIMIRLKQGFKENNPRQNVWNAPVESRKC